MRPSARVVGVVVALLLLAGCPDRGGVGEGTTATLPTLPPAAPAQTTTTAAGLEVPAVIDVAYAQRVLTALYHLEGEIARYVDRTRALDAEFNERVEAIYGGDRLRAERDEYAKDAAIDFRTRASPPGDPIVAVSEVEDSSPTCIVATGTLDFGPLLREPADVDKATVFQLAPATQERFNTTGWGILVAGAPDPNQNVKVCS